MSKEVEKFAEYTQLALHLHKVGGREGLLSMEDFERYVGMSSISCNWNLYTNSRGITHLRSPKGDHIQIERDGTMTVFGPPWRRNKREKRLKTHKPSSNSIR